MLYHPVLVELWKKANSVFTKREMMAKKNNCYEGMFLFKVKDAKEGWDGLVEHVGKMVEAAGGVVASAVKWEERKLVYDIKGHSRAAYMLVHFETPPSGIDSIWSSCKLSDRVLRVLILKDEKGTMGKVPKKEEDDGEPQQSAVDREFDEGSGA